MLGDALRRNGNDSATVKSFLSPAPPEEVKIIRQNVKLQNVIFLKFLENVQQLEQILTNHVPGRPVVDACLPGRRRQPDQGGDVVARYGGRKVDKNQADN
jgi:hypothetical protein